MNRLIALFSALTLVGALAAHAQQRAFAANSIDVSHLDVYGGYELVNANAPPNDCGCFSATGGFAGAQYNLSPWLSVAGELGAAHATKISSLGQNLTLSTLMGGPRVSLPTHRIVPFGEFLVGGAHGTGSYFPSSTSSTTSAMALAYSVGGGLKFQISPLFDIQAFDASFLHTSFPNGANGVQRQLRVNTGIAIHFGGARPAPFVPVAIANIKPKHINLTLNCSTPNQHVTAGQPVYVTGETPADPDLDDVNFHWTATGGIIHGAGNAITVDTANLQPGTYEVDGNASIASESTPPAECKVSFGVDAANPPKELAVKKELPLPAQSKESKFEGNLQDLFFDYDQSDLNARSLGMAGGDASYLTEHPEIKITIAGYADERGSSEYNIALGYRRATSTRDLLISEGVAPGRIQILSYGKEKAFCSEEDESCFSQNRRVQFIVEEK